MKIFSWNVNGLRAAGRKGFTRWLGRSGADVVLLQEVKAVPDQLPRGLREPKGWHAWFAPAARPGYSGVALLAREQPDEVRVGLGVEELDAEGRVVAARFGRTWIHSIYFPNGGRTLARVPYKLEFYRRALAHARSLREAGFGVVLAGDFNTAHADVDLARPKQNVRTSGFRPEEREALDQFVQDGWIDTFRRTNPDARDRYSWWALFADARRRNIGWRIDYQFVDEGLMSRVRAATIHEDVKGSDHCPVGLEVEL